MLKSSLPLSTISVNSAQRPEVIDREAQVLDLVKKIVATAPQTKPEPFNQRVSKEERQTGVLKTKPLKVKGGMARTIFVIGAKQVVALLGGFVPGPDSTRESQWWNTCVRSSELDSILHAKYVHEEEHEGLYHFLVPAKDAPDLVLWCTSLTSRSSATFTWLSPTSCNLLRQAAHALQRQRRVPELGYPYARQYHLAP
jgi:hypothetical protein